ncbi:MAG TPA: hypothetical protein VNK95_06115 [Caldilineaceae bacterium]|nr:hypothetical protein [Caldilineaceae bacterium]
MVSLEVWRDIAVVWLALLCFIGLLLPLAVALVAVKGMHFAVDRTPRLLRQAQGYSRAARNRVDTAAQQTANRVIHASTALTRLQSRLTHIVRGGPGAPAKRKGTL